eukprot:176415-Prorocentrum_minimum.AAC.1
MRLSRHAGARPRRAGGVRAPLQRQRGGGGAPAGGGAVCGIHQRADGAARGWAVGHGGGGEL